VLHETNAFLHTASNADFLHAPFGLTDPHWLKVNAADGLGSWERIGNGMVRLAFRKLLFDGNTGVNFGDLVVSGIYGSDGQTLKGMAHIRAVQPFTNKLLADFGMAGSSGGRISYLVEGA
jgi:hypothetical protein